MPAIELIVKNLTLYLNCNIAQSLSELFLINVVFPVCGIWDPRLLLEILILYQSKKHVSEAIGGGGKLSHTHSALSYAPRLYFSFLTN